MKSRSLYVVLTTLALSFCVIYTYYEYESITKVVVTNEIARATCNYYRFKEYNSPDRGLIPSTREIDGSSLAAVKARNGRNAEIKDVEEMDLEKENEETEDEEDERLKSSPYICTEERQQSLSIPEAPSLNEPQLYISKYYSAHQRVNEYNDYLQKCRYRNCVYTTNTSKAHLVIYEGSKIQYANELTTIVRPPNQRWLFDFRDPPLITRHIFEPLKPAALSFFNWTASYHLDADITDGFGLLRKRPQPPGTNYTAIYAKKRRLVALFLSHCRGESGRLEYFERMKAVIDVDVYGKCGNLTCGTFDSWETPDSCNQMLSRDYKFYLSFENSFCPDYVSEKFFKLFRGKAQHVIPVVRGSLDYHRYLPSGIFVDAADFKSPEDLARHLVKLGNDEGRYTNMLRKKDRWTDGCYEKRLCKVCEHLNTHWNERKFYPNIIHKVYGGSEYPCRVMSERWKVPEN